MNGEALSRDGLHSVAVRLRSLRVGAAEPSSQGQLSIFHCPIVGCWPISIFSKPSLSREPNLACGRLNIKNPNPGSNAAKIHIIIFMKDLGYEIQT